jgi:hypothetical protein
MSQPQQQYLTPDDVAARYSGNISVRTLANWRTNGDGPPFVKVGGRVMYRTTDLDAWEAKRTVQNTSQYKR